MKKYYLCFFYFITVTVVLSSQSVADMPSEPGKCYGKCLIEDVYESHEESYPVFMGEYHDSLSFIKEIDISTDENQAEYLMIVTDTTSTSEYIWETFTIKEIKEKRGFTEWREVVCSENLTKRLVRLISEKLHDLGYVATTDFNEMNEELKYALLQYQRKNQLPIGHFDYETLASLGVK